MATVTLNSGYQMPVLGLGTSNGGPGEMQQAVEHAIDAGYRLIDGAAVYLNEQEVGRAIKRSIDSGSVTRGDLFVTSKLWNTHHSHVREACIKSLADLQLDYLDLYLVHWPVAFEYRGLDLSVDGASVPFDHATKQMHFETSGVTLMDTWREMERLVEDGLVRSIGVSNYTIPLVLDLLAYCKIKPAVNQFEVHPHFVRPELRAICKRFDIAVMAFSPLGSGKVGPLQDPIVAKLALQYGKSPAQILLRWSVQVGNIVIPKSSNPKRIKENFDVFDFELTAGDVEAVSQRNCNLRTCSPTMFWHGWDFAEM